MLGKRNDEPLFEPSFLQTCSGTPAPTSIQAQSGFV